MVAWIVSAADAIDAMTSDRPYRKGMSLDVAIAQVREGAGTHFHPDVAEAGMDAAQDGLLNVIPQESLYRDAPAGGAFEKPNAGRGNPHPVSKPSPTTAGACRR